MKYTVAFQYVPLIAFYTENIYNPNFVPILSYFKPLLELNGGYKWIYPVVRILSQKYHDYYNLPFQYTLSHKQSHTKYHFRTEKNMEA